MSGELYTATHLNFWLFYASVPWPMLRGARAGRGRCFGRGGVRGEEGGWVARTDDLMQMRTLIQRVLQHADVTAPIQVAEAPAFLAPSSWRALSSPSADLRALLSSPPALPFFESASTV